MYTVDGTESAKAVNVVITVKETDKADRVYSFDFEVTAAGKAAAPTVKIASADSKGITVTEGPVTLSATEKTTVGATDFVDGNTDSIKFTVDAAADTTIASIKLGDADYTAGTALDLGDTAGTVSYVLTVTVSADGLNTATYTYNVDVTSEA